MPDPAPRTPRLPPRWFVHLFWISHRRLYRLSGGRVGLWRPKPGWERWRQIDENLDAYAARRSRETAVVVLTPRPGP